MEPKEFASAVAAGIGIIAVVMVADWLGIINGPETRRSNCRDACAPAAFELRHRVCYCDTRMVQP